MNLDAQQLAAVRSMADVTYVIAGPGSGKTRVLTERITTLCANGTDPRRVVVMTFTNAGANEFTKRLAPLVPSYAGTIHGFCLRLLQTNGHLIGYRRGGVSVNILDEKEQDSMLEAARDAIGLKKRITMKAVREHKHTDPIAPNGMNALLVWKAYGEALKRANMVDYDKLLTEGLRLLKLDAVRSTLRIDELLVDETQDSGQADWAIIDALPAKRRFIVGDTDQALYSWRGGDPMELTRRATLASGPRSTHTVLLETNYRSRASICHAAQSLIQRNLDRVPKRMRPVDPLGGTIITALNNADDRQEAAYIANRIEAMQANGLALKETAVLVRTNRIAEKLRTLLGGLYGIPIRKPPVMTQPKGWPFALLLISLAVDPHNDVYMRKFLAGVLPRAELDAFVTQAAIAKQSLADFYRFEVPTAVHALPQYLARRRANPAAVEAVEARLADGGWLGREAEPGEIGLFLNDLLSSDEYAPAGDQSGVEVLTIHGAKGREFDCVFVAGCEEGTLPLEKALKQPGGLEEERRLLFVAMTRARHTLVLTSAARRTGDQPWQTREGLVPSRFLAEL